MLQEGLGDRHSISMAAGTVDQALVHPPENGPGQGICSRAAVSRMGAQSVKMGPGHKHKSVSGYCGEGWTGFGMRKGASGPWGWTVGTGKGTLQPGTLGL